MRKNAGRSLAADGAIAHLAQLPDGASREAFLRRHRGLLRPSIVEKLAESVREKVRVNLDEALRLAEVAVLIGKKVGRKETLARGLRAKANALYFLGQNKAAIDLHEQAAALYSAVGDAKELGRTLSASIQPLILCGEYRRALAVARQARNIFVRCGDPLRLARLEINIGNIFHRQDRFSQALARYEAAYRKLLPFGDAEGIASSLHNIAVCQIGLNHFCQAMAAYERARAFCEEHNMPLAVMQADYNIAYLYYLRGEYSVAIEMLGTVREKADQIADAHHAALCRLDLADIYLELNLIEEAAGTAEEAFQRFQQLKMRYEAAKALTDVAIAAGRQGKTRWALELLVQAKVLFAEEGNTVWPSVIDLYRASIFLGEKQYEQARHLCTDALEVFKTFQLASRMILCRLMSAEAQRGAGNIEAAEWECREVLKELKTVEAPSLAYQAHFLMGQIYEARGNRSAAYRSYQTARASIEALQRNLHRDELKIAFGQNRVEVYERLIYLCLSRRPTPDVGKAFQHIEAAKSRSLRDLIARQGELPPAHKRDLSAPLRRMRDLRQELNGYYHRIALEQLNSDERAVERRKRLEAEVSKREKELLRVVREMPDYDDEADGYYQPSDVTVAQIRALLPPRTALAEFFRVRGDFWAVVVTHESCEALRVAEAVRINRSLALLQFQLSKFRLGSRYIDPTRGPLLEATQAHLRELYEQLIAPLQHLLCARRLIFVPHDTLHYLPFHALFDGTRYLIDSHLVSYAPSAGVLALCCQERGTIRGPSLILGVPDRRAPNILEEVQAISAILPDAQLFLGESASEEILREKGPSSAFIHIASHAYFRRDNPLFSGIRLGASYLTLLDLYRLNLPAQLVALSGCGTGMSVVAGGDELLGLVRGFLSAGSQSLLLTLWDVHDTTTAQFMKLFYSRLSRSPDMALALQSAMLELREEHPHPYYWAPYLLVGRSSL